MCCIDAESWHWIWCCVCWCDFIRLSKNPCGKCVSPNSWIQDVCCTAFIGDLCILLATMVFWIWLKSCVVWPCFPTSTLFSGIPVKGQYSWLCLHGLGTASWLACKRSVHFSLCALSALQTCSHLLYALHCSYNRRSFTPQKTVASADNGHSSSISSLSLHVSSAARPPIVVSITVAHIILVFASFPYPRNHRV